MSISFLCAEADATRKVDGHYDTALGFLRGSCTVSVTWLRHQRRRERGGDELRIGLVDPFGARIFISKTKHPKCNKGESEEPAGKDGNESMYGRSGSSAVSRARTGHSGITGAAAPEQADGIDPWRTDKHYFYAIFRFFPLNVGVGFVMTSLVL